VKLLPEKAAPPGVITASCCAPSGASAGIFAVISLALTTENVASWTLPIHTAVAPVKALPVMVSPDPMAPSLGEKLVISGAADLACCSAVLEKAAPAVCTDGPDCDGSAEEQPRAAKTRREAGNAALV
jgi:hypothetical protein